MCDTCHNELITALLEAPDMNNPATRTTLLMPIPNYQSFSRDYGNAWTDLSLIVNALALSTERETGEKLLRIFIVSVQSRVTGLTLCDRLEQLYLQYEQCSSERQIPIAANGKKAAKRRGAKPSPAYQLCKQHSFDLDRLVDTFLNKVRETQEIVGFAISCDYPKFLEIFRKRVEDTIRVHKAFKGMFFYMEQPYVLRYDTVKKIIDDIKSRKINTPRRYIFVPIMLGNIDIDISRIFWQKIHEESCADTQHVLVVVMVGRSDCGFPEAMIPLIPSFKEKDAQDWILNVGTRLMWPPEDVKAKWKIHMLENCLVGGMLDMESTYRYIDEVKCILQDEADLSFEKFLYLLEERSIYV